jgi:hypothetical protein
LDVTKNKITGKYFRLASADGINVSARSNRLGGQIIANLLNGYPARSVCANRHLPESGAALLLLSFF